MTCFDSRRIGPVETLPSTCSVARWVLLLLRRARCAIIFDRAASRMNALGLCARPQARPGAAGLDGPVIHALARSWNTAQVREHARQLLRAIHAFPGSHGWKNRLADASVPRFAHGGPWCSRISPGPPPRGDLLPPTPPLRVHEPQVAVDSV